MTGFEPATPWPPAMYSNQTEPHPDEVRAILYRFVQVVRPCYTYVFDGTYFDQICA